MTKALKAFLVITQSKKVRIAILSVLIGIVIFMILLITCFMTVYRSRRSMEESLISYLFFHTYLDQGFPEEQVDRAAVICQTLHDLDDRLQITEETILPETLDRYFIKCVCYLICLREGQPIVDFKDPFIGCFLYEDTIEEEYLDPESGEVLCKTKVVVRYETDRVKVLQNLKDQLGIELSDKELLCLDYVYELVLRLSGQHPEEIRMQDPGIKNNFDLVAFCRFAYEKRWGYVYGTYGQVLDLSLLSGLSAQYPIEVGRNLEFIRNNNFGKRCVDCCGLIKAYGWLDADTGEIEFGSNGMPSITADGMYAAATETGEMSAMPDIPGIAVWHPGHIGVYVGDGKVIEAMNTRKGVVMTDVTSSRWSRWLKIPYIAYLDPITEN